MRERGWLLSFGRVLRSLLAAALLTLALAPSALAAASPSAQSSIVGGRVAEIDDWPSIAFLLAQQPHAGAQARPLPAGHHGGRRRRQRGPARRRAVQDGAVTSRALGRHTAMMSRIEMMPWTSPFSTTTR